MPQSARHSPLPDLVGSWPISQIGGSPFILPNTVETNATILGTVREPSAGYDVDGASFLLWVDGVMHTVSFAYGAKLPLSEVVSQINSAVGASVASDDNGFLRLKSTTAGEGSSLRLQFNIGSTIADVLYRLGFFPETVAYSGDITQAQHVDPDRQVAQPGQMLLAEGESLTPGIFNRALFQLALNNDRNEGLLSKKQIAVDSKVSTHAYSSPGTPEGYQFSGGTYVFVRDTTTPGVAELEKLAVILDANGREFVKEKTVVDTAGITALASTDSATGWERISATAGTPFTAVHATGNYYIVCSSWTGAAAVLNGVPIKIVKYVNNTQVLVAAVDPATGDKIDLTPTSVTVDLVSVIPYRAKVSGIYDSQGGSRVEGVQISKRSSLVPDRVEKNNRLRITGSFTTAPAVEIGDLVHWSGLNQQPFSNNGTYRVASIPDRHTLELVNEDWTAAFLNPDLTGGAGTFDIESDGKFYKDPFFEFEANGSPEAGDQIQILYKGKSTIREATDDPSAFSKNRLFDQDLDGAVQKAILRIYGPSAETIDDVVYGDVRLNVETLCYRLDAEHEDEDGRHTYISCYDVIPRSPGIWDSGSSTNPWQEVFTDKLTLDAQDNAEGTVGGGWKYKGIGAFHKNTNQTAHDYGHSFVSEITARTGGPYETTAVSVGGQISSAMIANVVAGIWCEADNLGSGTAWLCDAYRGGCYIGASATGTIDDAVVFHAFNGSDGSGTINNYYGVKVDNITVGGTSNYAIYTGTGDVRFGDQTHILYDGSSGPTGWATAPALLVGGTTKTMAVGDDIGASFFEQEIDTVAAGATGWSTAIGARGYATHSANALSWMVGCYGESIHDGTGTVDWADSIACNIPTCSGGGTLTTGVGVGIYPSGGTTGTYVNSYGLFVGYVDEGGTDNYGIYVAGASGGTGNNYSIYVANGSNYFGGEYGLMVNDVNTTGNAPAVRVRGWRSDQNQSPSFSGRVVLSHWRTGGAFDDTYKGVLGAIIFGANHTDGSESNIAYPASIEARAEGTFSNLTTMPTALVFRTGSTGIATEDTPDVDFGSERMRIDKDGNVGVGASVVNADLHLQRASGPVFRVTSEESVTPGGGNVVIGSVEFEGQYNNWYRVGARVSAREDGNWSSSDNSSAATALAFYTEDISTSSSLATERMTIRAGGTVGINEPIPLGQLHVRSADSGITSVSTTYDELVVEGSGSCGITVVSEAASLGGLVFTADDHAGTFRGFITYDHNDDSLSLGTSGTGRVDIDSYGGVNHNMTYSTVTSADYGFKSYVNHSWNNSGYTAYGHYFECNHTGANADDIFGAYFKIDATGTTVAGDITGMTIDVVVPTTSASVAGTATCLKIDGVNQGGTNNITNMYGIAIGNMNQAITNNTALYIAAVSDATNSNYAIQTAGGDVLFGSPCKFYTRRDVDAVSASGTYAAESFMVFSISSGTQTDMVRGLESTLVNNSTGGTITDMVALRAYMDAGPNSGASITWMSGLEAQVQLRTSGGPSPLNTSGVRIHGATNQQSNISNQYGLKIEDISGASTSNYSIYTGAGEIRLGASSSDECRVVGARDAGTDTTSALYINTTTGQLGLNSSSLRVKRDVVDMGDTEWLYDTRPVRFTHKDSGEKSYGLIAEELLEVQPDLVYMRPWDTAKQVSEAYKPEAWERIVKGEDGKTYARDVAGIHYDRFIPILINELKKLRGRILHLEAAMAA